MLKSIFIPIVLLIFIHNSTSPLFANELISESQYAAMMKDSVNIAVENIVAAIEKHTKDSININSSDSITIINDDSLYMPLSQFMYADVQRYLITGGAPLMKTRIKPVTFSIFAGALAAGFVLQHELQMNTIWKEHSSFKFQEDAKYDIYIDKAGHFFGAYAASYIFREALVASGISWNASNNWAAALGVGYSTYVEILDGYGKQWGFSPSDWYADVIGGAFFAAQNYLPVLQNFSPKFMYVPSEWFGYSSRIPHTMLIDDYASQVFFMSVNIHNLLPDKWKKYYPSWLELSVGYAVRNLLDVNVPEAQDIAPCSECISLIPGAWGSPRLIFALDYNLVKLLPDGGFFWNWCKQTLNIFKLPSPALEVGKVTRFYLLFPFKIL